MLWRFIYLTCMPKSNDSKRVSKQSKDDDMTIAMAIKERQDNFVKKTR